MTSFIPNLNRGKPGNDSKELQPATPLRRPPGSWKREDNNKFLFHRDNGLGAGISTKINFFLFLLLVLMLPPKQFSKMEEVYYNFACIYVRWISFYANAWVIPIACVYACAWTCVASENQAFEKMILFQNVSQLSRSIQCVCKYKNLPLLNMLQMRSVPNRTKRNG